jgi:hypothetical protein
VTNETTPWQELREFASVDLAESFALSWQFTSGALLIDVDLFLCSTHPFYEKPRPSQGACFRPAEIQFPECTALDGVSSDDPDADTSDIASAFGSGKISNLCRIGEGLYQLSGVFGDIKIRAERPILRLREIT